MTMAAGSAPLGDVLALLQAYRDLTAREQAADPEDRSAIVAQVSTIESDARAGAWDRVKAALPMLARLAAYAFGKEAGKELTAATDDILRQIGS